MAEKKEITLEGNAGTLDIGSLLKDFDITKIGDYIPDILPIIMQLQEFLSDQTFNFDINLKHCVFKGDINLNLDMGGKGDEEDDVED